MFGSFLAFWFLGALLHIFVVVHRTTLPSTCELGMPELLQRSKAELPWCNESVRARRLVYPDRSQAKSNSIKDLSLSIYIYM
jgi:hypothetical protein